MILRLKTRESRSPPGLQIASITSLTHSTLHSKPSTTPGPKAAGDFCVRPPERTGGPRKNGRARARRGKSNAGAVQHPETQQIRRPQRRPNPPPIAAPRAQSAPPTKPAWLPKVPPAPKPVDRRPHETVPIQAARQTTPTTTEHFPARRQNPHHTPPRLDVQNTKAQKHSPMARQREPTGEGNP